MLFIARWIRRLLMWRRKTPTPPPLPVVAAPIAAPAPDDRKGDIAVTEIPRNRHDRRAYERARRKYDKFVTPKGALPEKEARPPHEPVPRPKQQEVIVPDDAIGVDDAELFIVDTHHENRADIVAYKETETYGEFNFRDTILQQLERYFVYLERMKKHDADAYGFYREIGATLVPYVASGAWDRERTTPKKGADKDKITPLADWFHVTRPAFGCIVYGADPETEKHEREAKGKKGYEVWIPKFMYWSKYRHPPPELQLISGGDIYKMTIWWDKPYTEKFKWGRPQEFGVFVSADGREVIALRSCKTKFIKIRHKNNGADHKRGEMFDIPQRAWHIPGDFERWAAENGEDVQHFLTEIFKDAISRSEMTQYSMTRVTASKGDMTAVFSVNIHRTGYFFADRDIELNEAGHRKRIFHMVRPHVRADGSEVKAHFRGEREFDWAGYHVRITIPGRDHVNIADFDVGCVDEYWQEKDVKYVDMPKLGKKMKGWMDEGRGKIDGRSH